MRVLAIVHQADAGPGVFAQSVAERGHELDVWQPEDGQLRPVSPDAYGAVMTFGGSMHPDQEDAYPWLAEEKRLLADALEQEVPLLAVCLGAQLLAEAAGASTGRASEPEIGWYAVERTRAAGDDPVLSQLPSRFHALEWHSYGFSLPPDAVPLASSQSCLQAYRVRDCAWGIQFHAEVTLQSFESWLESYATDPDALALGIRPDELLVETRSEIANWNELGRLVSGRFLDLAAAAENRVQHHQPG